MKMLEVEMPQWMRPRAWASCSAPQISETTRAARSAGTRPPSEPSSWARLRPST